MAELPTGTVTFMFTDIEGSTRLLQEIGERFAELRDRHAAIVRRAIARCDGHELGTEGDSFFTVFRRAGSAIDAAVAIQRDHATEDWSPGPPIRVRVGMHTGEGTLGGENYVGIDVNRAARIAAAAHGGQIIISNATRSLVEHALPGGVALRDLGPHRLKDLARPERLHDLVIEGIPATHPPPRTLSARPNNLPAELTSFIGRRSEMVDIRRLLGEARLVTLSGPGGSGKTRLALRVANDVLTEYEDGAFFVDLSSVTDPALVPSAIARSLGVAEIPGSPILDAVRDHLREKELLMVVDNFEQVTPAAGVIRDLLESAPRLTILVTSRAVLGVPGEHEWPVPPLRAPDPESAADAAALRRSEAVRLFADRAGAAAPGFRLTSGNAQTVGQITARLDGLPLAIELAATRAKVLSPEQLLLRLESRLAMLTAGAGTVPDRQRTLRDTIAWSHDLLEDDERRLFGRLAIFVGGWTLEAAEAVCGGHGLGVEPIEGLTALVDQSLVRRSDPDEGAPRFSMLETIREFALERLGESEEEDRIARLHAEWFLRFAALAEPHLTAADQGEWLDRCEREHPNLRSALRWAIEEGEAEMAQDAAAALWRFWQQRGHLAEGAAWFEEILAIQGRPTSARARALIGAGGIAWWQQDRDLAGRRYEEAVTIARELGDPALIAEAQYNLAFVVAGEDIEAAARMMEECRELYERTGDERGVAKSQSFLVVRDAQAGRWEVVVSRLEESTEIWRRLGERLQLAFDLVWLAFAHGRLGQLDEARPIALESLDLFREADNSTGMGIAFTDLAFLAIWQGRPAEGVRLAGAAETLRRQVGGPPGGFAGILEDDPVETARPHLDAHDLERAWEEGLAMSVDQAVAVARGPSG